MIIRVFPSLDRDKTKSWEGYDPVVVIRISGLLHYGV